MMMNLERIADSLESIDAVLRKIAKALEPHATIERHEECKEKKNDNETNLQGRRT